MSNDFEMTPLAGMDLSPPSWPPGPATLAQTLAIAGEVGERFALALGAGPGFIAADAMTDADHLTQAAARGRELSCDEDRVNVTLYLHVYAYRVAAPLLASWVLFGRLPDVSAENISLRFNDTGRPVGLALKSPRVYVRPGDHVADAEVIETEDLTATAIDILLHRHLIPVMEQLRPLGKLGLPLARGAVASQIGMALTFIDGQSAVPWRETGWIARDFLTRSADLIAGQGRSGDMHHQRLDDREGATFRRGTCCLIYRAPGKATCGGCPLRRPEELRETWRNRLLDRPTANLVTRAGRCG